MTNARRNLAPGWATFTIGLFVLAGQSFASSPSIPCDSPETTAAFREAFSTSGAPAAVLVFAVAENNPEYAEMAFSAASTSPVILKNIDAFAQARNQALEVQNVVAKDTKSSATAVCRAEVSFTPTPPAGIDELVWKLAVETRWTADYTATVGDDGTPAIGLGPSTCAGPACDIVAKYAPQVRDIISQASTALAVAQKTANETSAVGVMRAIQMGQHVFSQDCGGGFYAPSFAVLAAAPENAASGFIPAELRPATGERLEQSGYYFEITTDGPASTQPTCNGYPAGTARKAYTAIAYPKDEANGSRHFMIDSRGEIVQGRNKSGPWEPLK